MDNQAVREKVLSNGLNFVNIAKLIANAFANKTQEEQMRLKPREILPFVFESTFFENDLDLAQDEVVGFLEYIDSQMKTASLLKQDKQFQLIDYLINKSEDYKASLAE